MWHGLGGCLSADCKRRFKERYLLAIKLSLVIRQKGPTSTTRGKRSSPPPNDSCTHWHVFTIRNPGYLPTVRLNVVRQRNNQSVNGRQSPHRQAPSEKFVANQIALSSPINTKIVTTLQSFPGKSHSAGTVHLHKTPGHLLLCALFHMRFREVTSAVYRAPY